MKQAAQMVIQVIVASVILVAPLLAGESGQRYIVVIRKQRSGPPPVPDIARLGGTIESRQDDQLVVIIPARALAELKADPAVLYLERVGGTPDDESPLIGEPADPRPGTSSKRFTPHALGTVSWDSGNYAYDGAGNIVSIGSDNYLYDGVQRLKQSSTKGSIETYTYDGFGNMKTKTNTIIPNIQPSTNRYDGYTYNEVGAVKTDGLYELTYDALGQPLSKKYNNDNATQEYYIYTASDERIGVQRSGWWTWSVRDESGKVLRQYKSSATNTAAPTLWLEDFVWRDGLLLGSQRPVEMGGRRHFHLDHLGTPRLITSDSGQMLSYHDYYPFGDEHSPVLQEVLSGFDREEPTKFTGHERDYAGGMGAEDGHAVDYMHARYENGTVGRFLSVDLAPGSPHNPQSLNRYTYTHNTPINSVDPRGLIDIANTVFAFGELAFAAANSEVVTVYATPEVVEVRPMEMRPQMSLSGLLRDLSRRQEVVTQFLAKLDGGCGSGKVQCGYPPLIGGLPESPADLTLLNKSLASEAQLAEAQQGMGKVIAGAEAKSALVDEPRLLAQYGPGRWAKMSTWTYKAADGTRVETHFYKNLSTGQTVEFKSKWP